MSCHLARATARTVAGVMKPILSFCSPSRSFLVSLHSQDTMLRLTSMSLRDEDMFDLVHLAVR